MNLVGRIVKLAIPEEDFTRGTRAREGDVIGRVVIQNGDTCLVRLLPKYTGWLDNHGDFHKLNLPRIGTYWYLDKLKLKACSYSLMETE